MTAPKYEFRHFSRINLFEAANILEKNGISSGNSVLFPDEQTVSGG